MISTEQGGLAGGEDSPGVFHLISAHEVVPRWHLHPAYYALCGARVATASMTEYTDCPHECECEDPGRMACCPACVREALRLDRLAGVVVEAAPGGGLDLGDEVLLLILTRVHAGRIWRHYSQYFDEGRQVWAHVARALEGMLECNHLQLGEVRPDGARRLGLTEYGLARYSEQRPPTRLFDERGQPGPGGRDAAPR